MKPKIHTPSPSVEGEGKPNRMPKPRPPEKTARKEGGRRKPYRLKPNIPINGFIPIRFVEKKSYGAMWEFMCPYCNNLFVAFGPSVTLGRIQSCGCERKRLIGIANIKHGHGKSGAKRTREYQSYHGMMSRCYNSNTPQFHDYGGRGIAVCDRWRLGDGRVNGFMCFIKDMGMMPSKHHSIDRIKNHLGYGPDNCKWSTRIEQNNNTRRNKFFTHNGKTLSMSQWTRELGLSDPSILYYHLVEKGKPLDEVINFLKLKGRIQPCAIT